MDATGNFVIAWASDIQDGSSFGIYAQRYNSTGAAQGGKFRANTTTANAQSFPALAMDAAGNFAVAWMSSAQDGSNNGVYARRYNSSGTAIGGEFLVNTFTTNNQQYPGAAMDAYGNLVITWSSTAQDAGAADGVYAQVYDSNGVASGGEFLVNTTTNQDQHYSSVAFSDTGRFTVVWTGNGTGDVSGIFSQRYLNPGITVAPLTALTTTEAGGQATFTVILTSQPTSNVTIGLSSTNTTEG